MTTLVEMWKQNQDNIEEKKLHQLITFTGDGRIENKKTSTQLREYFQNVSSNKLFLYIEECLSEKFEKSGFILQDLINEVGRRLGFEVEYGLYRGKRGKNGLDGKWTAFDGHVIIIESKTTDAYRINLNVIYGYKQQLIRDGEAKENESSILIIVGREDTGDLEAQIRGSRYAWGIRLISVDFLIKLLKLKEMFNDSKTIHQIYEVLKPQEYTKIDKLIDLIFLTAQDAELDTEEIPKELEMDGKKFEEIVDVPVIDEHMPKKKPAMFHDDCIDVIQKKLGIRLHKRFRNLYATNGSEVGIIVSVSKKYKQGNKEKYWFAYHPYFFSNLVSYKKKYIAYGCGSSENVYLIPIEILESCKSKMWKTEKNSQVYWHIIIFVEDDGKFYLQLPMPTTELMDLTNYKI